MQKKIIKIKLNNHLNYIQNYGHFSGSGCGCSNPNLKNENIQNKKENLINKLKNRKIFL